MSASLRKRHSFCETWPVGQGQALSRITDGCLTIFVQAGETLWNPQGSEFSRGIRCPTGRTPKHQTVSPGPLVERILGAIVYEGIFCEELVVLIHIVDVPHWNILPHASVGYVVLVPLPLLCHSNWKSLSWVTLWDTVKQDTGTLGVTYCRHNPDTTPKRIWTYPNGSLPRACQKKTAAAATTTTTTGSENIPKALCHCFSHGRVWGCLGVRGC